MHTEGDGGHENLRIGARLEQEPTCHVSPRPQRLHGRCAVDADPAGTSGAGIPRIGMMPNRPDIERVIRPDDAMAKILEAG
jgi:hypothetical protein